VGCVICRSGEVRPGTTSFSVDRGQMTLVLKGVPARAREKGLFSYPFVYLRPRK
jgi:YgiT-type zinc finger domain-containing protein